MKGYPQPQIYPKAKTKVGKEIGDVAFFVDFNNAGPMLSNEVKSFWDDQKK